MTTKNTKRVQEMYAAFGRGDIRTILDALAPEITWDVPGPSWLPFFGTRHGREQVAGYFQAVAEKIAIVEFTPREFLADGDRVVVLGSEQGIAVPTGRSYATEWVHTFTFFNGQIIDFRQYSNTAAVIEAFQTASRSAA